MNELIAIKHYLGILRDGNGKLLKNYNVFVSNDELMVTDEQGDMFIYNPKNTESQRVQKLLFHEKQSIIENCLYGVDINSNSVNICRLRLWIELLKNCYYKPNGELETLPNIDINIKHGNSIISRFDTATPIGSALKGKSWSVADYKNAVFSYINAKSKSEKRKFERIVTEIKEDLKGVILNQFPLSIKLKNTKENLRRVENQGEMFALTSGASKARKKELSKLKSDLKSTSAKLLEIENSHIYADAFEWRFEFPESLDKKGAFKGFDAIIGNPPYGVSIKGLERKHLVENLNKVPDYEIYYWFLERARQLLNKGGTLSFILPNSILFNVYASDYRMRVLEQWTIDELLDCSRFSIFDDATVNNMVILARKSDGSNNLSYRTTERAMSFNELIDEPLKIITTDKVQTFSQNWGLAFRLKPDVISTIDSIKKSCEPVKNRFPGISQGLIAYDKHTGQSEKTIKDRIYHTNIKSKNTHKKWIKGENVTRYSATWNGADFIDYCEGIANPRLPKYFIGDRVLIREITNPRIFASLTSVEMYHDPSVIVIKSNSKSDIKIAALLGILNSKLATFMHFNFSPKATKGAFPKILVKDIQEFPLPGKVNKKDSDLIENQVLKYIKKLAKNSSNSENESKELQKIDDSIDEVVYRMYGLSKIEVRVVQAFFENRIEKSRIV